MALLNDIRAKFACCVVGKDEHGEGRMMKRNFDSDRKRKKVTDQEINAWRYYFGEFTSFSLSRKP